MSIDPSIPAFTGTVTRLTDTPLVAAGMFAPAALAGLEPDALANINGPSVLRMPDGLHFTPQAPLLGSPYFRATRLEGVIYLSMWEGRLGRMTSWEGPVELAPPIHEGYHLPPHVSGSDSGQPGRQIRHGHIFAHDGRIHMTFSRIGDAPERCLHCEVVPADDWADWRFGPVCDLLHPTPGWEGGDLPMRPWIMGTAWGRLHELRDPALFTDNGQVYMAYSGGAESGLGIARVDGL